MITRVGRHLSLAVFILNHISGVIQNEMRINVDIMAGIFQLGIDNALDGGVFRRNGLGLVVLDRTLLISVGLDVMAVYVNKSPRRFLIAGVNHTQLCRRSGNHKESG